MQATVYAAVYATASALVRALLPGAIARRLRCALPSSGRGWLGWLYGLSLVALAAAACVWGLRAVWSFTIDDAGISFAYAKHIADGDGPVAAIGGPWVEGYSNPLWVLLLVPVRWLGLELMPLSKLLGVALFVAGLVAASSFARLADGARARALGAVEACLAVASALCLELVVWVVGGLENALFSALLVGMIALDAHESRSPERRPWSGLAAFALSITRPEGAMYAAPLIAIKLAWALAKREPLRQALGAALLFVGPLALYHVAHYLVFGQLLPNTYLAKPGRRELGAGLAYLRTAAMESGLFAVAPLALLGLYGAPRLKLLAGWAWLAGTLFVLYSGGDWMPHARFASLFAPVVLALAAVGVRRLCRAAAALGRGRVPLEVIAFALCGAALVPWVRYQAPRLAALEREGWCHFCERVADSRRLDRLARQAGLTAHSVVTQDFGGPSWSSDEDFYPLDFLGLCDRSGALLRKHRARGGVSGDPRFYRYFIHEQGTAPSWIMMPRNFWPGFERSPEYLLDYLPLSPRLLPRARRDSFFALHRGELVDYFPPLPGVDFEPLSEGLALIGAGVFADPARGSGDRLVPDAPVLVKLGVVARRPLRGTEQLTLRLDAGGDVVESEPSRLDRGVDGVARALLPGEPLALEFHVSLPPAPAPSYRLSLALGARPSRRGPEAASAVDLGEFASGAPLLELQRELPRYPSDLPAPLAPELLALRAPVTMAIERARRSGRSPSDTALAERLIGLAQQLEEQGRLEQAYLAAVWATQVSRRAWEELADRVFRLRDAADGGQHALEIQLLRRYYASGDRVELLRLVAFYLSAARPLEARYFARRWPAEEPEPEAARALLAAARSGAPGSASPGSSAPGSGGDAASPGGVPQGALAERLAQVFRDPLGGALDFEQETLAGWQGDRGRFGHATRAGGLRGLRGEHGQWVLSSRERGERARGVLTSPEFVLDGRHMSVLVGGGAARRRVGVELVVDGRAALRASGNDSDNLLPVFWDISALSGKTARLRVVDQSPRSYVLLDRVLIWR